MFGAKAKCAKRLERLDRRLALWLDDVEYTIGELQTLRDELRGTAGAAWRLGELCGFLAVTAREIREARAER